MRMSIRTVSEIQLLRSRTGSDVTHSMVALSAPFR
jgi:hypothetical protein